MLQKKKKKKKKSELTVSMMFLCGLMWFTVV